MKASLSPRFYIQSTVTSRSRVGIRTRRFVLFTLIALVAVAALLGIAASANKRNRAAKEQTELSANSKSTISPGVLDDKQPNAPNAAVIVVTLSDNTAAAMKVAPGGTINYTAVISNTAADSPADDATSVQYSALLDANTTFVGGSAHASPIAINNAYTTVGNTLKLNEFNGNFEQAEMVKAFIVSGEYRDRFPR